MSVTAIRITYFQAEKLRCASGQRQASPYRITTYKGAELGLMGKLPAVLVRMHAQGVENSAAANQSESEYRSQPVWLRLKQRMSRG